MQNTQVRSLGREDTPPPPPRREGQPTPVLLPGEPHGQRSPVGYSPWGHRESDMSEALTLSSHFQQLKSEREKPQEFPMGGGSESQGAHLDFP